MADLCLYLLGPPRVKLDDASIVVKLRKALALLIYLAVTAEPHTRDSLATLLWPESDQRHARGTLCKRLRTLRSIPPPNTATSKWRQRRSLMLTEGDW